jgi:hypothetical protein
MLHIHFTLLRSLSLVTSLEEVYTSEPNSMTVLNLSPQTQQHNSDSPLVANHEYVGF